MSAISLIHQLESSSRKEIVYLDRQIIQRHCAELLTTLDYTSNAKQELKKGFTVWSALSGMHSENFLKAKNFSKRECEILQKSIDQLSVSEALFVKQIIEEYRGVGNLTNWGSALLNFVETDLVLFYLLVSQKSIFDIQELKDVEEFCILYFCKYVFNDSRRNKGLHYLRNVFGFSSEDIYRLSQADISRYMVDYISKKGLLHNKKIHTFDEKQIKDIVSQIKSGGYLMIETLVHLLLDLGTPQSLDILKQLRSMAKEADDVGLICRIDWYEVFGKDAKFPEYNNNCTYVPTGNYTNNKGVEIKTDARLTKLDNKFVLFENRALRGSVDETTAQRLQKVAPILSDVYRGYKTTTQAEQILKEKPRSKIEKQYRQTVASILKIKYNNIDLLD